MVFVVFRSSSLAFVFSFSWGSVLSLFYILLFRLQSLESTRRMMALCEEVNYSQSHIHYSNCTYQLRIYIYYNNIIKMNNKTTPNLDRQIGIFQTQNGPDSNLMPFRKKKNFSLFPIIIKTKNSTYPYSYTQISYKCVYYIFFELYVSSSIESLHFLKV